MGNKAIVTHIIIRRGIILAMCSHDHRFVILVPVLPCSCRYHLYHDATTMSTILIITTILTIDTYHHRHHHQYVRNHVMALPFSGDDGGIRESWQ